MWLGTAWYPSVAILSNRETASTLVVGINRGTHHEGEPRVFTQSCRGTKSVERNHFLATPLFQRFQRNEWFDEDYLVRCRCSDFVELCDLHFWPPPPGVVKGRWCWAVPLLEVEAWATSQTSQVHQLVKKGGSTRCWGWPPWPGNIYPPTRFMQNSTCQSPKLLQLGAAIVEAIV